MRNRAKKECYDIATPPPLGINFQITPRRQIFIHYVWLLSVELIDSSELVFSFNSAKIIVIGENLSAIYQAAMKANLGLIWPQRRVLDPNQPWVCQIILEDVTQEAIEQYLPFPAKHKPISF